MKPTTIRSSTPTDDRSIVDLENRLRTDLPPISIEDYRDNRDTRPAGSLDERLVAERDDAIVATAALRQMWWLKEPGAFRVNVEVAPECRGQGIGTELYERLLKRAREVGADRMYTRVREGKPESDRFATQRGFHPTGRKHRLSRLDVHAANLDGYEGIEERLDRDGIRIETLAEFGTDEVSIHALHVLSDETERDSPSSEVYASTPCDIWHPLVLSGSGMSPDWAWVAVHGKRPVGIAFLKREGERSAANDFTGTGREYRGRGIARALKLRTIEWARQNEVDYIYTGNDAENTRMLAINIRLGYQPLPAFIEMVKHLNEEAANRQGV